MFEVDKAVEEIDKDLLGRANFARKIAKDIMGWNRDESIVIGLYAKWGDGKTSIINFIKDLFSHPEKFKAEVNKNDFPTIIEFNPWIFSNQGSLIQSFLLEVGKELGQSSDERDQEIAKKIALVRLYLEPINKIGKKFELWMFRFVLPFLGMSVAMVLDGLFSFNQPVYLIAIVLIVFLEILTFIDKGMAYIESFYSRKSELNKKTLNQLKQEVRATLQKRTKKILFIIDDVDRLMPEEVRVLFQLIKINLDLPKLMYFIAMDDDTVGKMLSRDGIDGLEYIEKIVQIPLTLPTADNKILEQFLFKYLDGILSFFEEKKWDNDRWSDLYHAGLGKIFLKNKNLRSIKRSVSQMALRASLVSSEVDPVDFLGISTIQYFYPKLYDFIARNKGYFTKANHNRSFEKSDMDEIRKNVEAELVKVDQHVKEVVIKLFPTLETIFQNHSYAEDIEFEWKRKRMVCSENYFDAYFSLGVPKGEMSTSDVNAVIDSMPIQSKFSGILDEYLNGKKDIDLRKLLTTLLENVDRFPKDEDGAKSLALALLDISDALLDIKTKEMFDFGADMDLQRLLYFYLKNLNDSSLAGKIMRYAIKETKSLYGAVNFVSLNDRRQRGSATRSPEWVMSEADAKLLEQECLEKIARAEKDGSLKDNKQLPFLLFRWQEWGDKQDVKSFIEALKTSNSELVKLLTKFKSITKSSSGGSTKEIPKISFTSLKEFVDLDYLKEKLQKLELDKLPLDQKEAVDLFNKDFAHKDDPHY